MTEERRPAAGGCDATRIRGRSRSGLTGGITLWCAGPAARLRQESPGQYLFPAWSKNWPSSPITGTSGHNQGTRITGNLCHWIDLAVFFLEDNPLPVWVTMSPRMPGTEPGSDEERVLTVTFEDGSLLTVLGTTRGDDIRGVQEQIDIRRGRTTITIDDLWKMRVRSGGSSATHALCSGTRPTRPCIARRSAGLRPASPPCIRYGT